MTSRIKQLGKWVTKHQWSVFIIAVLGIALILTSVSLWLYQVSGAANLDLSRPGYEKVRKDVQDDSDGTKPFSPTGDLDNEAVLDFRSRYEAIRTRLGQMNNYESVVMSNENLGLTIGKATTELTQ
ncbi:MAG: DUF2868 domain-containing protein [Candidatus Nomurabacteria bacterium]|jgi:hypothetical protein|nr:DUF2868 domain-containing protein [Candidatus Nomurabacteria bacterium]